MNEPSKKDEEEMMKVRTSIERVIERHMTQIKRTPEQRSHVVFVLINLAVEVASRVYAKREIAVVSLDSALEIAKKGYLHSDSLN